MPPFTVRPQLLLAVPLALGLLGASVVPASAAVEPAPSITVSGGNIVDGYVFAPATITFQDDSASAPAKRAWDFTQDGKSDSTGTTVTRTFSEPGVYPVELTVSNGAGTVTVTKTIVAVKRPVAQGMVSRSGYGDPVHGVQSWVVDLNWAQCQPTRDHNTSFQLQPGENPAPPGGVGACTAFLDSAVAKAAAYNERNTGKSRAVLKVRIRAGIYAPSWAKDLGGGPMTGFTCPDGTRNTVPIWWSPEFKAAYANFVTAVGAQYDGVKEIGDFTISGASTCFSEPMLRQVRQGNNLSILRAHGYTKAKDLAAHKTYIDDHDVAFPTTPSSLALNPFDTITASGKPRTGVDQGTFTLLNYAQSGPLGQHHKFVAANNSVGVRDIPRACPSRDNAYGELYCRMRRDAAAGWPTHYQTETAVKIASEGRRSTAADLCTILKVLANRQHALGAELPRSTAVTPYDVRKPCFGRADALLQANSYSR